ncbi:MAG: hypothetical protein ACK4RK_19175 [Gemmataceae bacterium]
MRCLAPIMTASGIFCVIVWTAPPAWGLVVAPPALPLRLSTTDSVVVGTVTALEDKPVWAFPYPGAKEKVPFQVAVVQVQDLLKGPKGLTHVRVAFQLPEAPPVPQPGGGVIVAPARLGGGDRSPRLSEKQEALFFLTQHPAETFYVLPIFYDVVPKTAPNFAKDVALLRRCAKLLDNPLAGLKSNDRDDRLLTAAMLIGQYRTPPGNVDRSKLQTEPIAAEESRLILQALLEADFTQFDAETRLEAQSLFFDLGLTAQDGWMPPKVLRNPNELSQAAKDWLKKNVNTYRIQRYVVAEK